jgi:hypothetical protein
MKKILVLVVVLMSVLALISCNSTDYSGTYAGYSWKGESKGVLLEDAEEKIETKITLDKKGIITNVETDFLKLKDDKWIKRNDPDAVISVDSSVTPSQAILGGEKVVSGESMFEIKTNDKMSLYVVGVDENGTISYGIVDPITRYLFELKLDSEFDYSTKIYDLKINEHFIPTVLTSTSGLLKPKSLDELNAMSPFDISIYSHVITLRGTYEGVSEETTVEEFLTLSGVSFTDGKPQTLEATYGFHSAGGWKGNYDRIAEFMIGKDATELKGLTMYEGANYEGESYVLGINEDNFFGINIDSVSGATKTIQKSYDTISGATVRISRENTSFQRALVAAGIIKEEDVIKGRF